MIPTPEEIQQMPAGRELDSLMGDKLMGLDNIRPGWANYCPYGGTTYWDEKPDYVDEEELEPCLLYGGAGYAEEEVPKYSDSIHWAKQVQVKLFADGYDLQIWQSHNPNAAGQFLVQASKNAYYSLDAPDPIWAEAETEALAICRLALLVTLNP